MLTVGFVGLGAMGAPVATQIQNAGFPMVVCDLRDEALKPFLERGAKKAESPAALASMVDVAFTAVPMPKDVEFCAIGPQGILQGIREDGVYIDISTSSPDLLRSFEPLFRAKKAWVLDAPVGAGQPQSMAARGGGVHEIMCGGEREIFERVFPIFEAYGDQIIHCGKLGDGCICKLMHQLMGTGFSQVIVETMTLGVKAGVDLRILWESVRRGLAGRLTMLHQGLPGSVFNGRYHEPAGFTHELLTKDIGLALDLARKHHVPMPVSSVAEQIMIQALNRGWGKGGGYTAHFALQEEAAGVQLRLPGVDAREAGKYLSTNPETGYLNETKVAATAG